MEGGCGLGGIKDKVAIIGMGCTRFGERWDASGQDLIIEAVKEALEDANVEIKDIDAAWLGVCFPRISLGLTGMPLSTALKLPFLPVTHVENLCATGTEAIRAAAYAVAAGTCEIALVVGVEKLKDLGYSGVPEVVSDDWCSKFYFSTIGPPGAFAQMATRYFAKYEIPPVKGKEILAKISVKSHEAGALNPKAHLRRRITIEEALKAPIIAWPLGLYDCCGVSDGAAAAILVPAEKAKEYREDPIYIKALQVAVSSGEELLYNWDGVHIESTVRAAQRAYREAGIENPRKQLDLLELHDCFSITELVTYEDIGVSPRGRAGEDVMSGLFDLKGEIPCQSDGGLKCFGHPIGASGIRMMYEIYKQLQGKAGERQKQGRCELGLTHNLGGYPFRAIAAICILGAHRG